MFELNVINDSACNYEPFQDEPQKYAKTYIFYLNVQNTSRIRITNKKKKYIYVASNRGKTPGKKLEVGFTPSFLHMRTIGAHFICFISHVGHHCSWTPCIGLSPLNCFQKTVSYVPHFFFLQCSCSKLTNEACCLSFSIGRRHLARNFLILKGDKEFFFLVCCL